MTQTPMSIRDAARWAARKDILVRAASNGEPDYLYAAYSLSTNMTECIGYGDKCHEYGRQARAQGRHDIRVETLEGVYEGITEEQGETRCIPSASEQREWA